MKQPLLLICYIMRNLLHTEIKRQAYSKNNFIYNGILSNPYNVTFKEIK